MKNTPIIIGVAGGSGSGKTTVTRSICNRFEPDEILVIEQDYYYKDQADIPFEERLKMNYDHPFAFDMDLMIADIQKLMKNQAIDKPLYDYKAYTRAKETEHVEPKKVIILEGILILEDARLRDLMDIKVYVDTDADLRFIRRLERDRKERGRSVESVVTQYLEDVRPAHLQFIEPTKRYADMILPEGGENHVAIDLLATKVEKIMGQN